MRRLLLAAAAAAACAQQYDEELAKKLVLLSDAAYCGDAQHGGIEPIASWTCAPCQAGAPLSNVSVFGDATQQTLGFVGVTSGWNEGRHVVVSFRGSVLSQNFHDDADTELVPHPGGRPGRVHRGMYRSFASLKLRMLERVGSLLARLPDARGVLVTGHSLGAAQAVFAADELAVAHPDVVITTYSFGTPKVGDATFVQHLNATSNLRAWAVAHRADTVPQCGIYEWPCPGARAGYRQLLNDVWYPDGLAPAAPQGYVVCNGGEDPYCEDSVPPRLLNWDDHNLYLGHTMWCCDGRSHGTSGAGCPFPFSSSEKKVEVYA